MHIHKYLYLYQKKKKIVKNNRERKRGLNTCEAQAGTFMETSNTVAPQAIEEDFRGSDKGSLFPSLLGSERTSWLFSIISFFI